MNNPSFKLTEALKTRFGDQICDCSLQGSEVTIEVGSNAIVDVCVTLRDEFEFEQLVDLCGIDYSQYGLAEWDGDTVGVTGFSRGCESKSAASLNFGDAVEFCESDKPRFAVVIHLISYSRNQRLRVRYFAEDSDFPIVPSLTQVWSSADWNEREAFDLFGIMFDGHNDLRRILTDYGFVGHPFRKDFPLIGNVEMRYDPEKQRVVYQPVTIQPRVLVPRVVRGKKNA